MGQDKKNPFWFKKKPGQTCSLLLYKKKAIMLSDNVGFYQMFCTPVQLPLNANI